MGKGKGGINLVLNKMRAHRVGNLMFCLISSPPDSFPDAGGFDYLTFPNGGHLLNKNLHWLCHLVLIKASKKRKKKLDQMGEACACSADCTCAQGHLFCSIPLYIVTAVLYCALLTRFYHFVRLACMALCL